MTLVLKAKDLKNEFRFIVSFEEYDDMFLFLYKYNPLSIHIEKIEVYDD